MNITYNDVINYWKKLNINSKEVLEQTLDNFRILFAYNSGAIENEEITYHNTREIFENGKVINFTGNLKTLFEISNQKACYEYLLDKIIKREKISENLIKKVHELLTIGTYDERRYISNGERPGEYKKHDYVTGREEVGTSANEVAKEIENLVNEINSVNTNDAENIIKIATYFHNKFENIHPFADGNGRVGRTLLNYILMINDLPPLIIYDEDKEAYYKALEKYDKEEDINIMIEFIKYEMVKTWSKKIEKEGIK